MPAERMDGRLYEWGQIMKYRKIKILCAGLGLVGVVAAGIVWTGYSKAAAAELPGTVTGAEVIGAEITGAEITGAETGGRPVREEQVVVCGGVQYFFENGDPTAALSQETLAAVMASLEQEEETGGEYADLAIANVDNYVNVRTMPSVEGDIAGKIYHGAVAQILDKAGDNDEWLQIISGNVEGYIKAEYFLYGESAASVIDEYVTRYAVVDADRLNVREEPDLNAKRIGYVDNGERLRIQEDQGEWFQVQYTGDIIGYVASEYVTVTEEYACAKTLEEEARELEERRALEARQNVTEQEVSENTTMNVTPPSGVYATNEELRSQIVDYAMQFLGNVYIHGGKTLEGGTDCSGFTSLIYAEFGYSVSRTPAGQLSNAGRSISYSEIQPGDIICYGSKGKCTHVAMYIGDGQIIHSANPRKGVVIFRADYDTILGVKNLID